MSFYFIMSQVWIRLLTVRDFKYALEFRLNFNGWFFLSMGFWGFGERSSFFLVLLVQLRIALLGQSFCSRTFVPLNPAGQKQRCSMTENTRS